MTEPQSPVLVIATTDPESRVILERELRVRYGSEYTVVVRAAYGAAERLLVDLAQQDQPVAFVLACYNPSDRDGLDFLGRARAIAPTAKRAIAVTWGDFASTAAVFQATAEGKAEMVVIRPERPRDEEFHGSITDALVDWQVGQGMGAEAVRLIANERDPQTTPASRPVQPQPHSGRLLPRGDRSGQERTCRSRARRSRTAGARAALHHTPKGAGEAEPHRARRRVRADPHTGH